MFRFLFRLLFSKNKGSVIKDAVMAPYRPNGDRPSSGVRGKSNTQEFYIHANIKTKKGVTGTVKIPIELTEKEYDSKKNNKSYLKKYAESNGAVEMFNHGSGKVEEAYLLRN